MSDQIIESQMIEQTNVLKRIATALEIANAMRFATLTDDQRQAFQKAQVEEASRAHRTRQGGPAALSELGR